MVSGRLSQNGLEGGYTDGVVQGSAVASGQDPLHHELDKPNGGGKGVGQAVKALRIGDQTDIIELDVMITE